MLVHIQFAKYAGAAACYPPSRMVVDVIFNAHDKNQDGTVDEEEFTQILVVCCAQITSRILVYYGIIILLVPYAVDTVNQRFFGILLSTDENITPNRSHSSMLEWQSLFPWNKLAETVVSLAFFFLLVPTLFNCIDNWSRQSARIAERPSAHTTRKTS